MTDETESGRKLRTKDRKKCSYKEIDEDDIDGRCVYSLEDKLTSKQFDSDLIQILTGPEFTMEWMQKYGLVRPILFYEKTGLGLRVPNENFKVSDVKQCVGSRRVLDVMDVTTQKGMEMTMKDWTRYYENPRRDRLLNVISLEFCHTRLESYVDSPTLVRQVDWVERAWPRHLKECQTDGTNAIEKMKYPKVQKYCLMSVAGCYTDFHIDFGGTSVWYHILHGEKIFWLAPPTTKNIEMYVEWTLSAKQGESFLGDVLDECQRVFLKAGYTFIIPSGWIHAVYTPKDSLVFGGNFLHSFNIENQLLAARLEDKTYVPPKFRYPFFSEIMWYVADRYIACLTGKTFLSLPKEEPEDSFEESSSLPPADDDSQPPALKHLDSRTIDESGDGVKIKTEPTDENAKLQRSLTVELTRIDSKRQADEELGLKSRTNRRCSSDPTDQEVGETTRKWTHLTWIEIKGLKDLVEYLSGLVALPPSKRGVPKELFDPFAVLREMKQLLEDHKFDDQTLAVSGEPVIGWPDSSKKKQKIRLGFKNYKTNKSPRSISSGVRQRRVRCNDCEACHRPDCGECSVCREMGKSGGSSDRLSQSCVNRQCVAPLMPSNSVCSVCNQDGRLDKENADDISTSLMECAICLEVAHPFCLQGRNENLSSEGVINEDLPNSWDCPRCSSGGKKALLKPKIKSASSLRRYKSEEWRAGRIDTSYEDEECMSSPLSPLEGKRVTSKESLKNLLKYPAPIKAEQSYEVWPASRNSFPSTSGVEQSSFKSEVTHPPSSSQSVGNSKNSSSIRETKKQIKKEKSEDVISPPSKRGNIARSSSFDEASVTLDTKRRKKETEMVGSVRQEEEKVKKSETGSKLVKQEFGLPESSSSSYNTVAWLDTHFSEFAKMKRESIEPQAGTSSTSCFPENPIGNVTAEKQRWGVDYTPKVPLKNYVVRPAPPPSIPDRVPMSNGQPHPLPRLLWTHIFSYLAKPDLARLSAVCSIFDCWHLDPALWQKMDLSRKSIRQAHLKGIVLRQPRSLKLASAVISYAQLSWLIARLPGLKLLDLSNLSWASICALCSPECPLLNSLDLSWATGIRDLCFRELASPPGNLKPGQRNTSRLCQLERLSLTGTDINDQSLEVLATHLPRLLALDLTCCMRVTDRGIRALVQLGEPCKLREIRLVKCVQLTDRCLESLHSCRDLTFLALTDIPAISQEACVRFSRSYKHRTLRAHAHGLISV